MYYSLRHDSLLAFSGKVYSRYAVGFVLFAQLVRLDTYWHTLFKNSLTRVRVTGYVTYYFYNPL